MVWGDRGVSRRCVLSALGVFAVGTAATGHLVTWLLTAVVLAVLCRVRPEEGVAGALPGAFLAVLSGVLVLGLLAGAAGLDLYGDAVAARAAAAALTSILAAVALLVADGRRLTARLPRRADLTGLVWTMPALVTALTGLVTGFGGPSRYGWIFAGDHLRLMGMVAEEMEAGGLRYGTNPYPRAIVTLHVTAMSASGAQVDAAGLISLSHVMACVVWLVLVMIVLAMSSVARSLALTMRTSVAVAELAGLLGGTLTLLPMFLADYVARGFEAALLALLCMLVMCQQVLASQTRRSVVVAVAAVVTLAHTWQLVLPGAGVAFLVIVFQRLRAGSTRDRWAAVGVAGLGALLAVPGVLALVGPAGGVGAGHIAVAGDVPSPVLVPCVVACLSLVYLARLGPWESPIRVVVLTNMVTALLGFVLARSAGVPIASYYPNKVLWIGVLTLVPFVALALAALLGRLNASQRWARSPLVVVGVGSGLAVAVALVSLLSAPQGVWSTVDGDEIVQALSTPGADQADVFWADEPGPFTNTVQVMLRVFDPARRQDPLPTGSLEEQCALLAAAPTPMVLTTADVATALARFSCVEGVQVVSVEG